MVNGVLLPRHTLGACVLLLLSLGACGQSPATPQAVRGFEVAYSLLTFDEVREVVEAPDQRPPTQDLFKPRRSGAEDFDHLPAVIVHPPTRLRYELPAVDPAAELRFSLAPAMNGYVGTDTMRVQASLDGQPCFDVEIDCSKAVPEEERRWRHHAIPVPEGGTLEFHVTSTSTRTPAPSLGLGRLQVGIPFEAPRATAAPGRPNVVVIVVDTLRADRLGCYGGEKELSPVMDALAARGTRYANAYSAAPWTLPGTASILTGKTPPEHGIGFSGSFYLADAFDTLAEPFQRQGITTGAFSCNPLIAPSRNFDQGFEHFSTYRWARANLVHEDIAEWLAANKDSRFLLYYHPVDPHYPYEPTEASAARLVGPAPEGFLSEELRPATGRYYKDPSVSGDLLVASNAHQFELYDAEVFDVDEAIGRVLAELEALGILDQTIVAVTSDHGEEFLEHGWVGHTSQTFDEQTHVPLILAGPGIPEGAVVETRLQNRYLFRTLLEAASVPFDRESHDSPDLLARGPDGRLAPDAAGRPVFLVNGQSKWADFESRSLRQLANSHSMIDGNWRMVFGNPEPASDEKVVALYDLSTDPECLRNVASTFPGRAQKMRNAAQAWMVSGKAKRPAMVPTTAGTIELLKANGYVGGDED